MGTPLVGDLVLDLNVDNKRLKNFFLEKVKILKNNCNKNNLINQR